MRRPVAALAPAVLAGVLALSACATGGAGGTGQGADGTGGPADAPATNAAPEPTPSPTPPPKELPGGGRTIFPAYRLVGYSGIKGTGPGLGRAGVGNIDDRMTEITERAKPYAADGRKIMPTLEFIATVVQPCRLAPKCRTVAGDAKVQEHLDAVRKVDGMLLLAIQPGRSPFIDEVRRYEKFLKEPDVGVALDPEWRMGPTQEPMRTFGSTDSSELNAVGAYLSKLVKDHDLPEKVMLYHMIRTNWVRQPEKMTPHSGVVQIVSVDGIGSKAMKVDTWKAIMGVKPRHVHPGFKMFYKEDTAGAWKLMTPTEVMSLRPKPTYVLYE